VPQPLVSLPEFYRSRTGRVVRRLIRRRLTQIWPDVKDKRILGTGYAVPYLSVFTPKNPGSLVPVLYKADCLGRPVPAISCVGGGLSFIAAPGFALC
jgi:hypothetical protein